MENQQQNPQEEKQTQQSRQDLNISEIDLSQVPVAELIELKDKIDLLLSRNSQRIGDNDLVLEYTVKLRTKDGIISNNEGVHRLNAILHPRLLSDAPSRFETEFIQNVFTPVNADAYDLFDTSSGSNNPLSSIKSQTNGLLGNTVPTPSMGLLGNLPGE